MCVRGKHQYCYLICYLFILLSYVPAQSGLVFWLSNACSSFFYQRFHKSFKRMHSHLHNLSGMSLTSQDISRCSHLSLVRPAAIIQSPHCERLGVVKQGKK